MQTLGVTLDTLIFPFKYQKNHVSFQLSIGYFNITLLKSVTLLRDYSTWKKQTYKCWRKRLLNTHKQRLRDTHSIYSQLWDQCSGWLAFLLLRKDQWREDQLKKDRWRPDKPSIHKKRDFAWRNSTLPGGASSDLIIPKSYILTWILTAAHCKLCLSWVRTSSMLHRGQDGHNSSEPNQERISCHHI